MKLGAVVTAPRNFIVTLTFLFLFQTSAVFSNPLSMIFFYPGGDGSSEDAQPFLDAFTQHVHESGGPLLKAVYVNDFEVGLQEIKQKKHALGILSLEAFLKVSSTQTVAPWLTTYPLASDGPYERYFLLGKNLENLNVNILDENLLKTDSSHPNSPNSNSSNPNSTQVSATARSSSTVSSQWHIYNPKPVDSQFVNLLFSDIPSKTPIHLVAHQTENILGILKRISTGELSQSFVLMDTYEYQSFKKLSLDWTKNIRLISVSKTIPSSPLVIFGGLSTDQKQTLEKIFLGMSKNSKETLRGLRLKGFAPAQPSLYQEVNASFSRAK